jgi:cyclophilin family peptidyl-prolyl cis-trans isomerase
MRLLVSFGLTICLLLGCGGGGSTSVIEFKGIKIEPATIRVKPNESIQLTAVVDGSPQPIVWSVVGTDAGTATASGKYTAPKSSGTYGVKVSLKSDPTKSFTANAIVDSAYVVKISGPTSGPPTVATGETVRLSATVQGASSNAVTWATDLGTISADGTLNAETLTLTSPGEANVTATSTVDPGKKESIKVKVVPLVQVISGNSANNVIPASRIKFKALVRGEVSNQVTWSASSGTIATDGTWTAGSTLGNVTVTATSIERNTASATTQAVVHPNLNVRYRIENRGDVVLSLRPDKAPNHCANLVSLVNDKFYDGIILHRYEAGFVIQWGDPLTKTLPLSDPSIGTGGPGYTIDFEANDLLHTKYALGMARSTSLNSAGSQIYLCLDVLPSLDGNYVVFGLVTSGTDVVDALRRGDRISQATVEIP